VEHGTLQFGQRIFVADSGDHFWVGFSTVDHHLAVTSEYKYHVSGDCGSFPLGAACLYALAGLQTLADGSEFFKFFI
jgi:hypothetical protein